MPPIKPEKANKLPPSGRFSHDCTGPIGHYFPPPRRNSDNRGPNAQFYGDAPELVIGLDTEYSRKGRKTNQVLSYQFFASAQTGDWKGIHYPEQKRRISLSHYISAVNQIGLKVGILKEWPQAIYFCAHYAVADFPAFMDPADPAPPRGPVARTFP